MRADYIHRTFIGLRIYAFAAHTVARFTVSLRLRFDLRSVYVTLVLVAVCARYTRLPHVLWLPYAAVTLRLPTHTAVTFTFIYGLRFGWFRLVTHCYTRTFGLRWLHLTVVTTHTRYTRTTHAGVYTQLVTTFTFTRCVWLRWLYVVYVYLLRYARLYVYVVYALVVRTPFAVTFTLDYGYPRLILLLRVRLLHILFTDSLVCYSLRLRLRCAHLHV